MKSQTFDLKALQAKCCLSARLRTSARFAATGLLDLVGGLISDYDARHFQIEVAEPREALRLLIEQNTLKQTELEDIVPQGNLSAILAGKRQISRDLAKKLAQRFNVSVSVFV